MLAVVSPAKKLDFEAPAPVNTFTQPDFLDEASGLIDVARKLSREELMGLMKISETLADLNYGRYRSFTTPFDTTNAKQAIYSFRGDTYVGLDADSLSDQDVTYAQDHLAILSGLYGVLRPLDLMQPYRLEMGTKLNNPAGKDLYAHWGTQLAEWLDSQVEGHEEAVIINLASNEYFKAVPKKALKAKLITPVFKEIKNGQAKVIGLMAKRARGMMARYMIQNQIEQAEGLKAFDLGGYGYVADASTETEWTFMREQG